MVTVGRLALIGMLALPAGSASAQPPVAEVFVGGGVFSTDTHKLFTGDAGLNVWLLDGVGLGFRHSLQTGRSFDDERVLASLSSLTVNLRRRINDRVTVQGGWVPVVYSVISDAFGTQRGAGAGIYPLFDFFVTIQVPNQPFAVRAGANFMVSEGAWLHPMGLVVFSF